MTRAADPVRVSVIIPTYQRPAALARCLASLAAQRFPPEAFEILVIDDGSDPPAAPGIPRHLVEGLRPAVLRQPNRGPGAARMMGVRAATGEVLAFLDDDCAVPPDYLATVARIFTTHPDLRVVQVGLDNPEPENLYGVAWKITLEETLRLNLAPSADSLAISPILGGVMACRREAFAHVAYDPALPRTREDVDLRRQLMVLRIPVHYAPDVRVWVYCRRTLRDFVLQHVRYGRDEVDLRRKWGSTPLPLRYPRLLAWRSLRALVSAHGVTRGAALYGLFWLKRHAGMAGLVYETVSRDHPTDGVQRWVRFTLRFLGQEAGLHVRNARAAVGSFKGGLRKRVPQSDPQTSSDARVVSRPPTSNKDSASSTL